MQYQNKTNGDIEGLEKFNIRNKIELYRLRRRIYYNNDKWQYIADNKIGDIK